MIRQDIPCVHRGGEVCAFEIQGKITAGGKTQKTGRKSSDLLLYIGGKEEQT